MNILFVTSSRSWGGGETWLTQVSSGLGARGHRIVAVCRHDSALRRWTGGANITVIPLKITGDFNPASIIQLLRIITRHRIDVVCTNMEEELRLARVPVIPSVEVDCPIKTTWLNKFCFNRLAAGVLVNSYATLNTLLQSVPWLAADRMEVIWKGVDADLHATARSEQLRTEFDLHADDCIVGFVGRLDEQTGIPTLLLAMKHAVERAPNIRLIVAGDGNMREEVMRFRRAHKLEEHVLLAGFRDSVPPFLKGIDFLVMPSYWEGFGYAAIEAMAAGKAVIGTRTSSLPEIIEENETGLRVPPKSPVDLANAILALAGDSSRREMLGVAGQKRVRTHFAVTTMITRTEAMFLRIINLARQAKETSAKPRRHAEVRRSVRMPSLNPSDGIEVDRIQ